MADPADMILERGNGFYRLRPISTKATDYLAARWASDFRNGAVLLPEFFGDAATLASYAVRDGHSLSWGPTLYPAGPAGADTLFDEVG